MRQHVIALVDCDCFFVSCERKDNPLLQGKPVCVMTGGGSKGIIVSRSKEAKALGIKMGQPYFQVKPNFPTAICVTARHHRYTEISKQVMDTIKTFSPDVEVTSVDEAFIDLTSLNKVYQCTYTDIIKNIRQTVWDKVGIPVSIGLGTSKTLAKLASDKAKSNNGIFVIPPDKILDIVGEMAIEDVSGIGRKNSEHMKFSGIFTIKDFVEKENGWIRKAFGINGLNLKSELTGIATSLVKVSEQITYSLETPKWFHVELINDYYKGSMKSLIYLEKEVKRMEKEHNNCLWEYGVAVSTLNEMRKALIVGMFHLWLHNLQEYLVMSGNEFHPKKIIFANSGFDTIISIFKDITDKDLIAKIKKYSTLINAIKHGIGKSLTDLKHNYSEFFYPSEEYTKTDDEGYILEDAQEPLVSKYHFEELHKSLLEFWKSAPDKIIVDVNKLGKKD